MSNGALLDDFLSKQTKRFIDSDAFNSLRWSQDPFPDVPLQQPGSVPMHYAAYKTVSAAETCLILQMCKKTQKME